jgi:hypothetical protein
VAAASRAAEGEQAVSENKEANQMADYDLSIHTNPDAMAWTKFFRSCQPDCNVPDDVLFGWFANAMMAMHDHLRGGGPINGDHAQFLID